MIMVRYSEKAYGNEDIHNNYPLFEVSRQQ